MVTWTNASLAAISVLAGLAALWAFGRFSNQRAIEIAKRRVAARLYELRLFVDEPSLIWQAQGGLIRDNLRYLWLTLVPGVLIAVPMYLLLTQLDAFYGRAPLEPGRSALVTLQTGMAGEATLSLPSGFVAETAPVRMPERNEISWRVRASRPAAGMLRISLAGHSFTGRISAEPGLQRLLSRSGPIEIDYPPASINWLLWFFVISMASAFLFRRPLGVKL